METDSKGGVNREGEIWKEYIKRRVEEIRRQKKSGAEMEKDREGMREGKG